MPSGPSFRPLREDDKLRHPAVVDEHVRIIGDNLADVTAEIGAYAVVGPSVVIRRKAAVYGFCRVFDSDIGERASVSPFCVVRGEVGNDAFIGDGSVIGFDGDRAKLGYDCFLGMRVVVPGGVTVGEGAVVGAGSRVEDDVDDYTVVTGDPAEYAGDVARFSGHAFVGGEETEVRARLATRGYDTGWEHVASVDSVGVNLALVTWDERVRDEVLAGLGRWKGSVEHGRFSFGDVSLYGIAASARKPPVKAVERVRRVIVDDHERILCCILDCPSRYGRDVVVRSGRLCDEPVTGPLRARGSRYYRTEDGRTFHPI